MKLHHTVVGTLAEKHARSIELNGLKPFVADAYKDLVPEEIRRLPVVWFAEGVWQGYEFPVFEVDGKDLDKDKLYHTAVVYKQDRALAWWVYAGFVPPGVVTRIN